MNRITRCLAALLPVAVLALPAAAPASAQTWPTQNIKWVVPYPPGGNTDVLARAIAEKIGPALGQAIIVENRPGANTITGTNAFARADDGHTIGLVVDSHSINAAFGKPLPYDSVKDFAPIVQLVRVPFVLVTNTEKLPVKSLAEFIAYAKANPGKINFGALGPGSPHQMAMEWFRALAGIEVTIVPYRGVAPAMTDVVAGHVQSMVTGSFIAVPHIESGKIRPLAVTSAERLKLMPNVPTIKELGFPSYVHLTWYGVMGPRSMPPAVVARLNTEINKALALPDIREKIAQAGAEPVGGTVPEFEKMLVEDLAKFREVIKISGAKAD